FAPAACGTPKCVRARRSNGSYRSCRCFDEGALEIVIVVLILRGLVPEHLKEPKPLPVLYRRVSNAPRAPSAPSLEERQMSLQIARLPVVVSLIICTIVLAELANAAPATDERL